jgi:hypothetical protein
MLAKYVEGVWSISGNGVTVISGPSLHVLSIRPFERTYAYASPTETWAMRKPRLRRKDRRQ